MDEPVKVEAIFLAASDPKSAKEFYSGALGLGEPELTPDGQYAFSGTGVFFAVEPLDDAPGAVEGQITVWYRVGSVLAALDRLTADGAQILQAPEGTDEVVAVLRGPAGQRIGLIGPN